MDDTDTTRDAALGLLDVMIGIRLVEERLHQLFSDGEVPGFLHLSVGQEAVAAGVCAHLSRQDTLASTHRGHGHALAKGVPLDGFFLELLGRDGGLCRGRGGSMHVADFEAGMLGANGIVGAGLPLAVGSALSHQVLDNGRIAVAVFGDGALAEGAVHESLNMAALWRLPIVFVCENNGWSEFSPSRRQFAAEPTAFARAFGIEALAVDGNDALAVSAAFAAMAAAARAGRPGFLECLTTRVHGHFVGDPQRYRPESDIAAARDKDPVARLEKGLLDDGVRAAAVAALRETWRGRIEAAVARARRAPSPSLADALQGVYAPGGAA
jgi:acetoin:2,6-dichlorophenolindophenol oxidoreductase subunit alpha